MYDFHRVIVRSVCPIQNKNGLYSFILVKCFHTADDTVLM